MKVESNNGLEVPQTQMPTHIQLPHLPNKNKEEDEDHIWGLQR